MWNFASEYKKTRCIYKRGKKAYKVKESPICRSKVDWVICHGIIFCRAPNSQVLFKIILRKNVPVTLQYSESLSSPRVTFITGCLLTIFNGAFSGQEACNKNQLPTYHQPLLQLSKTNHPYTFRKVYSSLKSLPKTFSLFSNFLGIIHIIYI